MSRKSTPTVLLKPMPFKPYSDAKDMRASIDKTAADDSESLRLALSKAQADLAASEKLREKEKAKAFKKSKKAHAKLLEALAALELKLLEALTALELSERKAKAEKARADELEQAVVAARLKEEKLEEILERVKNENVAKVSGVLSTIQKMGDGFDKVSTEMKVERDTLRELLSDKEREVEKMALEKEALEAKVEALSICIEDTLRKESSKLEEEYDKVSDYEWECCKVDESDLPE